MLKVDLGRLARQHRVRIDTALAADDPLWDGAGLTFDGPVSVGLDVQPAGEDVVVRGRFRGTVVLACRRCVAPVRHELDEELTLVYRAGLTIADAEAEEVYPLPPRGQELDLAVALLEHIQLAVPQYVICSESCRGFCPRCGRNLNQASCECVVEEEDPRWAALRRLRSE
ncbi:MAG TPA: DUF177 domain-containing protein [Longimicrobiales bacterium]|nr:DUF177 domain-containing protein [Longimicrobiales bacterium]